MLTPDRNKALVRRWLEEVFSRGDLDAADGLFTSNCVLHDPSFLRDVYGPEGIRRYVSTYRVAFSDLKVTVEDQLAEEDKVVTRWTARGTHSGEFLGLAPTRQEIAVSGIEFDRVAGGRIDEAWVGYHPFAGPALDSGLVDRGSAAMAEAFPDLRMIEADGVKEDDKVAFRWLPSGTHLGVYEGCRHVQADRGDGNGYSVRGRRRDSRALGRIRRNGPAAADRCHPPAWR